MVPGPDSFSQVPFGYQELDVDFDDEPETDPNEKNVSSQVNDHEGEINHDTPEKDADMIMSWNSIIVIVLICGAVLLFGIGILVKSNKE